MKSIEKSARTVDEAVNLACQELGVDRATVEYVVVDPGSKGVLGLFGGKEATVRVTLPDNPGEDAIAFLQPIFEKLKALKDQDSDKLAAYTNILYTQACMIEGLPVEDPVAYANEVCKLLLDETK